MERVQVEYLCGSGVSGNRFSSLPKSNPFNRHEMGIMFVSGEVLQKGFEPSPSLEIASSNLGKVGGVSFNFLLVFL